MFTALFERWGELRERFLSRYLGSVTADEIIIRTFSISPEFLRESKLGDTFKNVKADLDARRSVLFSGTSCQVAGLKKYLGKEYGRLGHLGDREWRTEADHRVHRERDHDGTV